METKWEKKRNMKEKMMNMILILRTLNRMSLKKKSDEDQKESIVMPSVDSPANMKTLEKPNNSTPNNTPKKKIPIKEMAPQKKCHAKRKKTF